MALTFGNHTADIESKICNSLSLNKYWLELFDSTKTNMDLLLLFDKFS